MYDFIFILGAQGSGKTTTGRLLKKRLESVFVDFDWIRDFHLNSSWSNVSDSELKMSYENLLYLLRNYHKNSFKNVIVVGIDVDYLTVILEQLHSSRCVVITLVVHDDEVLKKRVLTESRDSGFRDYTHSIELNKLLKERTFMGGYMVDNTDQTPEETVEQIVKIVQK